MGLYRAIHNLTGVCAAGALTSLAHLTPDQVQRLIETGAVSRVRTPPLDVLPDWASRAGKLKKIGILTVEDFLEADPARIAETLRVKPETVDGYRVELNEWLVVK